jgi:hypothetical protein
MDKQPSPDPLAGMHSWNANDCSRLPAGYPLATVLSTEPLEDERYVIAEPVAVPVDVARARALLGQPVATESEFHGWKTGCLVEVQDDGTLVLLEKSRLVEATTQLDVSDLTRFGTARLGI